MNKYTPMPWKVTSDLRIHSFGDGSRAVAEILLKQDGVADEEAIANARRIVACVNACEGINPEAVPDLLSALKDLFKMMDEKILVRNIEHDHKPEWAGLLMGTVTRLKFAHDAITKAEGQAS